MGWGAYIQNGFSRDIDVMGSQLSLHLHCPVHYPAYDKRLFECKCGVIFPVYLVEGEDWVKILRHHSSGSPECNRAS